MRANKTTGRSKQICKRPVVQPVLQINYKSYGLLPQIIPHIQYHIFFTFSHWTVMSIPPIQLEGLKKTRMISGKTDSNLGMIWTGSLLVKDPEDYH
jgi:hypothetical protein